MTKEVIKEGASVEEARAAAMLELGITDEDDFHTEVIRMPEKKFLGLFGGHKAEVKVSIEIPDEKPAQKKPAKKANKPAAKPQNSVQKKAEKPAAKQAPKEPAQPKEPAKPKEEKKPLVPSNAHEKTAAYITSIVNGLGLDTCDVQAFDNADEVSFELSCGDDYGIVIGRRGETLDAIQYLARMVENRGTQSYKRVSINVGNYREKREAALVTLAQKQAARVLRTNRSHTLEPMNPYERRIIHTAIQDVEGVTSYSIGEDLNRRVVIALEGQPQRQDTKDYGRHDRRDRRDRRDRPKREPYVPEVSADRQKHSDAAGVSCYGKIEVKKDVAAETEETAE